jgi:hypothetical protein
MKATINSQVFFKNGSIPYEAFIIAETEKAFRIEYSHNNGDSNNRKHTSWIPKSVVISETFKSCNAEYLSIKSWFVKNIFNN